MARELTDMTLEELWELFPIALVEHDERWEASYRKVEAQLEQLFAAFPGTRISHIGSTAIPDIQAKDIVDVLVEIPHDANMEEAACALVAAGFTCMDREDRRASFNLGYTKAGFADEVFHVHLRFSGDNDELYFRDYLLEHPHIAWEYEALKTDLAARFEHDRDGYTDAKAEFVRTWTDAAKTEYAGRYELPDDESASA